MTAPQLTPTLAAVGEALAELERAERLSPPMRSAHEGLAIVEEEFLEFRNEVFWGTPEKAREECIQVVAMGLRFLKDITP